MGIARRKPVQKTFSVWYYPSHPALKRMGGFLMSIGRHSMTKAHDKDDSFEEFLSKRSRLSEMAESIGMVVDVVVHATEGLITDQELCDQLEQLTKGKIEREKNMPALTELEDIKNVCDRFFRRDRSVSWIDVGVVILQLEEKYQHTLARIISHALRSGDHTNI